MRDFHSSGERKSKPRNSSSSSESKSPLDKRQRETLHFQSQDEQREVFEEEPRGEDEASVVLEMDLHVTSKLDQILAKLAKLDAIEATLNEFRQNMVRVESEVSKLEDDVGEAKKRLDEMDKGACSGLILKLTIFKVRLRFSNVQRRKNYMRSRIVAEKI